MQRKLIRDLEGCEEDTLRAQKPNEPKGSDHADSVKAVEDHSAGAHE